MNSTTSLLIIIGSSTCLLLIVLAVILPYESEDMLNIKHPNPKPGPCASQRVRIVLWVWLVPTLLAVAGWMVWG